MTITECTQTNLDSIAYCTSRLHRLAPRLHAGTTCYCTKQHDIKSNARENDAIKRHNKREMHEAASGITGHTILRKTCLCVYLFFVSRKSTL